MQHKQCLVFGGRRGLDQAQLRQSVARIPEVSKRIKQAQALIDQTTDQGDVADLFSALNSWDGEYSARPKMRSLLTAIVQVGLSDRFVRQFGSPQYMVGNINGVSAMGAISGQTDFEKMVTSSDYFIGLTLDGNSAEWSQGDRKLTLAGMSLEEFGVLEKNQDGGYDEVDWETKDCYQLLSQLNLDFQVEQFVHIGPSLDFRTDEMAKRKIFEFSLGNSVEMDPILNSFWKTA